jgi:uncharacterized protein (TIGR02246 family)
MRLPLRILGLLVGGGLLVGCLHSPQIAQTPAGDPTPAIQALLDQQAAAWNRGDIQAFMAGYERSEQLLFTSGANIRRGFDATLAKYQKSYVDAKAMGHLTFTLLDVRAIGPQGTVALGEWKLTETPREAEGIFTLVLVQSPEGWRIVHDHTSARKEE